MRKPRLEIKGGLYHILTRGNNRQRIFRSDGDCDRFLTRLARQKARLPFYLYAYCLMPNHIHLLVERRDDFISEVMQRLLTAYSQYYNRKYSRSGHLLQGRYKAILCESDQYLAELVRYIHLNPVRAGIVRRPEEYAYSSHCAYLGLDADRLVDVEPVLRHFGAHLKMARKEFNLFVRAGMKLGHKEGFYRAEDGRMLGSEEWLAEIKNRIGEIPRGARPQVRSASRLDGEALMRATETVTGMREHELRGNRKTRVLVRIKEVMIIVGRELGATNVELGLLGIDASVVSRRHESGKAKFTESPKAKGLVERLREELRREE